jgi:serine/threonine protein kinase/Flp pilus assembly protein TadD
MSDATKSDAISLDSLVAEVADEFMERQRRGEQPDIEQYAKRYPEFASVLRQVLSSLELVRLSSGSAPAVSQPLGDEYGLLGDFRIIREVGRGGMGIVYEARQLSLNRRVALKVLPFAAALDPRQLHRFTNEAQAAAHLHHTNIVPVFGVFCERGIHFYAMQFIDGNTLADMIASARGPEGDRTVVAAFDTPEPTDFEVTPQSSDRETVPIAGLSTEQDGKRSDHYREIARLGVQAAEALAHAHAEGIIHRDIKPANLLVDARGNLWITDFGLARLQNDAALTVTGDLVGTIRYMSPEQALGDCGRVDERSDVYSLGATLYEMLTLRPVFEGKGREELLRQIASEEPRPPRRLVVTIPVELELIVLKALEKEPEARYATAQELADDLRRFLADEPIRARRPSLRERARKWARRHRAAVASAMLAMLVALTSLGASVGWIVRDRAAERQKTALAIQAQRDASAAKLSTGVQTAIDEARRFQRQEKWQEALTAVERAAALVESGRVGGELERRVHELHSDIAMVVRLDVAHLLGGDKDTPNLAEQDRRYARAFQDYGIDLDALDADAAAALIGKRRIREQLASALDRWARVRRTLDQPGGKRKTWKELLTIAQRADPDPQRLAIRDAVLRGDRQALLRAARQVPDLPVSTLLMLTGELGQANATVDAIPLLRRGLERHPGDFWLNYRLANYLGPGSGLDWKEALRYMTAAAALRPDTALVQSTLGLFLASNGQRDEALQAHQRAVKLQPDLAEVHCNLGKALWEMGRSDESRAEIQRALDLKPDLVEAHVNMSVLLNERGRFEEAIACCRRAIQLNAKLSLAHLALGNALNRGGRQVEALACYRRAIELQPDFVQVYARLGNLLQRSGHCDEAIAAFRKGAEAEPNRGQGHVALGVALVQAGRADEAIVPLDKAVELMPRNANAFYWLGTALLEAGKCADAHWALRQAIKLRPDHAEAYCNLGEVLMHLGDFAGALEARTRGHELGSQQPGWRYPSGQWVKQAARLLELEDRFDRVLRGDLQPANGSERLEYAEVCIYKRHYLDAARLSRRAFSDDRSLADRLDRAYRYNAACSAALVALGKGVGGKHLSEQDRADWRKQAITWLRDELKVRTKQLQEAGLAERTQAKRALRIWQKDPDLASLRDPDSIAKLSSEERSTCKQLWSGVEALLSRPQVAAPALLAPKPGG